MSINDKKTACGRFYMATDSKEMDNGTTIYCTISQPGVRVLPLGYFFSEDEAVDALYSYLTEHKLIP